MKIKVQNQASDWSRRGDYVPKPLSDILGNCSRLVNTKKV